jgi:hypothetical protein
MGFLVMLKEGQALICPERASPNTTVSIGVREGNLYYIGSKESLFILWYMTVAICVSYGTGGWDTYTTRRCRFLGRLSLVSHISVFSRKACAEGVHLARMPRMFFQVARVGTKGSWILYIQM